LVYIIKIMWFKNDIAMIMTHGIWLAAYKFKARQYQYDCTWQVQAYINFLATYHKFKWIILTMLLTNSYHNEISQAKSC